MNYADIKETDTANGEGVGVALFVSGCRNHCKGCFNKETWDFNYGEKFTVDIENTILNLLSRDYIDYFSILGGDPFEPENVGVVLNLVKRVRNLYPNLQINIWSGYLFEDLILSKESKEVLSYCDLLIDGKFEEDKFDYRLKLRGSSNQRIIDLKKSLKEGYIINKVIEED